MDDPTTIFVTTSASGSASTLTDGSTSTGTTASSTGATTTAGVKLDLGTVPDFGGVDTDGAACGSECQSDEAGQQDGSWLLNINEKSLQRVDVANASTTALCNGVSSALSLTFTRDNRLFASSGSALFEIDPCTCNSVNIGSFPFVKSNIYGIAPDEANELFGISAQAKALVRIDTHTAQVTTVGALGVPVGLHGAAWSEQEQTLYMITNNHLYTVNTQTGAASEVGALDADFSTVGVEIHPGTDRLYGCTGAGDLYEVDKLTAKTTLIGHMKGVSSCTNLGAPWAGSAVCLPIPG